MKKLLTITLLIAASAAVASQLPLEGNYPGYYPMSPKGGLGKLGKLGAGMKSFTLDDLKKQLKQPGLSKATRKNIKGKINRLEISQERKAMVDGGLKKLLTRPVKPIGAPVKATRS